MRAQCAVRAGRIALARHRRFELAPRPRRHRKPTARPGCHGFLLYHWSLDVLRHTGRAAKEIGRTLHHVSHFLLTVAILLSLLAVGGAWRLSRGPVDLGFLRKHIEQTLNNSIAPAQVTIGGASDRVGRLQSRPRSAVDPARIRSGGRSRRRGPPPSTYRSPKRVVGALDADRPHSAACHHAARRTPRVHSQRRWLAQFRYWAGQARGIEPSPLAGLLAVLGAPTETDLQPGGRRLSQLSAVSIHGATLRWMTGLLGADLVRRSGRYRPVHGGVAAAWMAERPSSSAWAAKRLS